MVRENPYQLADDVSGIGFRTADKIAREVGIAPDSPHRAAAAVKYWLSRSADEGHCYSPRADVVKAVGDELQVPPALVEEAIESLKGQGQLFIEEDRVYLAPFFPPSAAWPCAFPRSRAPACGSLTGSIRR